MWLVCSITLALATADDEKLTFEACYRLHKERVFHWCLRFGSGSVPWAEDVTHDVFLAVHRRLPELDTTHDVAGWLYRVTAHLAFKRLKREGSLWWRISSLITAEPPRHHPSSESLAQVSEQSRALLDAVKALPGNERMVVWMTLVDGLRGVEIADALALSKGQVSKLLARGTERLKALGWEVRDGLA